GMDTTATIGLVTDNGDGTFDYDPNGEFESLAFGETTTDTFTYTISDGEGSLDTATVTVTVNGVNDPPVAEDDNNTTDEDTIILAAGTTDVRHNDSDPDGDSLTMHAYTPTSTNGAAVTMYPNGTYNYDPTAAVQLQSLAVGETLVDTFQYVISDDNGGTDTGAVTITITGVNDNPTANPDSYATDEDTAFTTGNVLTNDTDPDVSDILIVVGMDTTATIGLVTDNGDGTF
ncbi:MAG: tandem-95 repeat protein, partial [bacterium]|nr:tandem-95 repeat protein [bacterium]